MSWANRGQIVMTDVLASDVFSAIRSSSKNDDEAVIQQMFGMMILFPFLIKMEVLERCSMAMKGHDFFLLL